MSRRRSVSSRSVEADVLAAAILWLLASPFVVGAVVARWSRANRFVARHYWPSLFIGWAGLALLLAGVFVLDATQADIARMVGGPLGGLSFWMRNDGDDWGDRPDDAPPPDWSFDWDEFGRDFGAYVSARDRPPACV